MSLDHTACETWAKLESALGSSSHPVSMWGDGGPKRVRGWPWVTQRVVSVTTSRLLPTSS